MSCKIFIDVSYEKKPHYISQFALLPNGDSKNRGGFPLSGRCNAGDNAILSASNVHRSG
jgi:hypothetical protein